MLKNKLFSLLGTSILTIFLVPSVVNSGIKSDYDYMICNPRGNVTSHRIAIKIVNNSENSIWYWYTDWNKNGKPRWYKHEVKAHKSTWDWSWSDATIYHPIEFFQPDKIDHNQGIYTTILLKESYIGSWTEPWNSYIYSTKKMNKNVNPLFNKIQWNCDIFSAILIYQDQWNMHGLISFN